MINRNKIFNTYKNKMWYVNGVFGFYHGLVLWLFNIFIKILNNF